MNQIPNIEDEKTGIEELDNLANIYGWHHEKCAGHSHFPSCPVVKLRRVLIKEQQTLHQQLQKAKEELQKARQDWLQEEIVKLKGMIHEINTEDEYAKYDGQNKAIQTIIDRYDSELDQDNK